MRTRGGSCAPASLREADARADCRCVRGRGTGSVDATRPVGGPFRAITRTPPMDPRTASIEHIHQLALMLIRLFADPRWEQAVARQAEAALQAAAQGWQQESDPRLRDASRRVLRRLERADHFDGAAAIDRSPLIEQLLALRDELLVGDDPGTDPAAPGITWADLAEDEPQAARADGVASARFAAAATAEAIARLRRAHQAVDQHALVSVTDRRGVITEANERFCEVSGYHRDELLGTTHRLLKSGRHSDAFYRQMWETILAGEVWHGEICNRRKDGAYYWVQSTILPILDADGRPDQFVSIRTDVTALKATEERLGLLERAMHSSSSGVVIVDALRPHAPVIYASRAFGEMVLQGEGDPAGRALAEVLAQSGLQLAAEGELPAAQTLCAPGPGGPRTLDLRWAPVLNEAGVRTHWAGVATDITEIEQARRRRLDSEERLRRSQVYADIGTWDWNIQTGELYWSERIAPLFGYPGGDLETSYIGISPEHVDLLALVRESLDLLAPVASQRGVTLEPLQGETTYVLADRTRLKQVLANLLSNAIKYNRTHGWVRVEMRERGGEVSVTVRDSGRGLTDEQQARLFEPFEGFGAEELGIEGTGIGLAISKRLVELMRGRIEVESIAGVGSAFTVTLPAGRPPTVPAAAVEASAALPAVEGPPRKVLYVEDNPDNVALVREVLAPHRGWQLLVAPSAMLGIELAVAHQPDLVLLDINLPQMDGFAFLQMLRGHVALDATPVIAVTADVTGTTLRRLREAGFFGLVEKPIDIARLVGLIEAALADPGPAP